MRPWPWIFRRLGCLLWGHVPTREVRALARIWVEEVPVYCIYCGKELK